ncbi:SRPBCC family protein [Roseateles cellulosilyticus]|uniref:SRPBCC family protein n=1 Tax=Pelomonas cellulosilytica TaxID=2906762 RepID=A0ABS8XRP5_9BURK|nr:SRPBCC family protein [Pelomonas sp. P8]MCE4553423.1 SRPBCC family protein [Pelomonas sp. P8]
MSENTYFDLVSHWRLDAPVGRVWQAITDTEQWPHWWPGVVAVRRLHPGDELGVGRVQDILFRTGLGYRLQLALEVTEVRREERLRARAGGTLAGEGIWLLHQAPPEAGGHTDVTFVWRVTLPPGILRRLAPVLAPLFRWNHRRVMRAGRLGLQRHLGLAPA